MFEDTGLYSQMRIQLYPRKVVYFMYLIRILISNNTMRSKHVFVQNEYDTRIKYKDTIHTERIGYDTRIRYRDTIQSTIQGYC